ncbi:MAG TPA: hypothetical protein VN860_00095 [Candidatus Acidoferrales bacterium]|nr:hypothetical protein [Candidatus Acidoferrales bacterium]
MTLEFWNTVGTLGTFVVITASAIAALVQLRHLRQSNQLPGLLAVLELFQQPNVVKLINFIRQDLPTRMQSDEFRAGLEKIPVDRKEHPELHLCEMYEEIGSYMRTGIINEALFLTGHWYNVLLYWDLLHPVIQIIRRTRPFVFENFEYLATRALLWKERHPDGNYPTGARRMLGEGNLARNE